VASSINAARGMRDFLPAEKARRERVLGVIKRVYAQHGFDEIETPVVEDFDRLHSGLGGDNEKLSFSILKRGIDEQQLRDAADSGDVLQLADLGLRYDLTVPLARFYASHRGELPAVFRSLQTGSVWRAERPQKGRYRQFVQCDIDIVGESGSIAEIELITATTAALDALGLEGTTVRVNDRRILAGLLESWGVPSELRDRALITIDKLDKVGVDGVVAELDGLGIRVAGVAESLREIAAGGWDLLDGPVSAPPWLDHEAYRHLLAIRAAVPAADIVFDPTLVRGMGYYTGTIFEITHPGSGGSVAGGGRYDGMIGRFLGQQVPAVGFSIGFERIVDLVPADSLSSGASLVLVYDPEIDPATLIAVKSDATTRFERVRLERRPRNLTALLDTLTAAGWTSFSTVSAAGAVSDPRALG
jgi:histidyl-tRNA synthetase